MYRNDYGMPANANYTTYGMPAGQNDDRFLFPFILGGVAGGALGYGIANNNNNNNPQVFYPYPPAPYPPMYYGGMEPYPIYYSYRG